MAASDGIHLKWVRVTFDGVYQISQSEIVPSDNGCVYFSGDTPEGEFTFGIAGHDSNFVAIPNGNFNVSKNLRHGFGVVILCSVAGITGSGKEIYIAYAGNN